MISNPMPRSITKVHPELEKKLNNSREDIIRCDELMRAVMHGSVTRTGKENLSQAEIDQDRHLGLIGLQLLQILQIKGVKKNEMIQEVELVSNWSPKEILRIEKVFGDLKDKWTLKEIASYYGVGENLLLHQIACVNSCLLNMLVANGQLTKSVVFDTMAKYDNGMSMENALTKSVQENAEYVKWRENQAFVTEGIYPTCDWIVDADGKLW